MAGFNGTADAGTLHTSDVVNNLNSTDPTKVLAAPQGKALNDKIGTVPSGQTVEGQISSLDSKIYLLENAPQIANGTDLNTVDTEGRWWAFGGNGCLNVPVGVNAFGLIVVRTATDYIRQIIITGDGDDIFVRRKNKNNDTFGNWEQIALNSKQTLTATTDSAGRIISDIPFANVRSVNVESTVDNYCACRQSTGGKAVFFVFNAALQIVANTQVSLTVWLA